MGFTVDTQAITAEKMGYTNKMALLEAIRRIPGSSRLALSHIVGLDPSTVSKIVATLIRLGLVKELGSRSTGTPGRRSVMLSVVPDAAVVMVVSIGVERTKIALGKLDCSIEPLAEIPTNRDPAVFFDELAKAVSAALPSAEHARSMIVSVPGILDTASNVVFDAPNIGWGNVDIHHELKSRIPSLDLPVETWNDANLSLVAEIFVNPRLFDMNYGICVYLSNSIGGAIWSDGKVYLGAHNAAGELGHATIDRKGPVCLCGRRGCLNSFVSIEKVVASYDRKAELPLSGDTFHQKMNTLFERMEEGDLLAKGILERTAVHVGEGVANMLNTFDPEFVAITGAGSLFTPALVDKVSKEVNKRVLPPLARDIVLLPGTLSAETSSLIGATLVGVENLLIGDLRKL